jgi:hypothetical protein
MYRHRNKINALMIPLGIIVFIAIISAVCEIPKWQINDISKSPVPKNQSLNKKQILELEDTLRKTIIQGLGSLSGALFLITAYFTWKQYTLTNQKQSSERFAQAISQLGNKDSIAIRLGGIYSLRRLAEESGQEYYKEVVAVLTHYVRENAAYRQKDKVSKPFYQFGLVKEEPSSKKVGSDIQAILDILKELSRLMKKDAQPLDLSKTDLQEANLDKFGFPVGSNLEGANLENASLERAILKGINLNQTNFKDANLKSAHLEKAKLSNAIFTKAYLFEAKFNGVQDLGEVDFSEAILIGAEFKGVDLTKANLTGANLEKVRWDGAILTEAIFTNTKNLNEDHIKRAIDWGTIRR